MNRIAFICTLLMCVMLFSCQKNGNPNSNSDEVSNTENIDQNNESSLTYTLHPLVESDSKGGYYIHGYTLRMPSGEFVMFDNDQDYSYIAPYAIRLSCVDYILRDEEKDFNERLSSFNRVYEVVDLYLSDRKSEIKDMELKKKIDKFYYDYLQNVSDYFYETESAYNSKRYDDDNDKWYFRVRANDRSGAFVMEDSRVERKRNVPEGILYFRTI